MFMAWDVAGERASGTAGPKARV